MSSKPHPHWQFRRRVANRRADQDQEQEGEDTNGS
jgi:hypothetical protein